MFSKELVKDIDGGLFGFCEEYPHVAGFSVDDETVASVAVYARNCPTAVVFILKRGSSHESEVDVEVLSAFNI